MSQLFPRCGQCGSEIEDGCVFCPNCGASAPQSERYQANRPHPWMDGSPSEPLPPRPEPPRPPQYQQQPYQQQPYQQQYAQPPAPIQQVVYQQYAPQTGNSGLASAGRVLGIVSISLMLVGLVPCLGWVNWIMLPLSLLTFILSLAAAVTAKNERARGIALMGLVFAVIAGFVGFFRLVIGGGCL